MIKASTSHRYSYFALFIIPLILSHFNLLSLIRKREAALKGKDNVIYLIDNVTNAVVMEDPDIYKIKRHLSGITGDDIYLNKSIPIFTEDAEARLFLQELFVSFEESYPEFANVSRFFHQVEASISCTNLQSIFNDTHLLKSTLQSVCVLDGDQGGNHPDKNTLVLPGGGNEL